MYSNGLAKKSNNKLGYFAAQLLNFSQVLNCYKNHELIKMFWVFTPSITAHIFDQRFIKNRFRPFRISSFNL